MPLEPRQPSCPSNPPNRRPLHSPIEHNVDCVKSDCSILCHDSGTKPKLWRRSKEEQLHFHITYLVVVPSSRWGVTRQKVSSVHFATHHIPCLGLPNSPSLLSTWRARFAVTHLYGGAIQGHGAVHTMPCFLLYPVASCLSSIHLFVRSFIPSLRSVNSLFFFFWPSTLSVPCQPSFPFLLSSSISLSVYTSALAQYVTVQ